MITLVVHTCQGFDEKCYHDTLVRLSVSVRLAYTKDNLITGTDAISHPYWILKTGQSKMYRNRFTSQNGCFELEAY